MTGETIRDALRAASEKLGIPSKFLSYRVLERGRSGFLGIGRKDYKLMAYEKEIHPEDLPGVSEALKVAGNLDGYFEVTEEGNELKLTVFPPRGAGKRVNAAQILHYLKGIGAEEVDEEAVGKAIHLSRGKPLTVARRREEESRDSYAKIEISGDWMSAFLTILPPKGKGKEIKYSDIEKALHREGITFGIHREVIEKMVRDRVYDKRTVIAEGKFPVDGKNARVELEFEPKRTLPRFEEDAMGRVDLREMNLIDVIKKGDLVARKLPPEKGVPGRRIDGKTIPCRDGIDIPVKLGPNVEFDEVTGEIRAVKDGQPTERDKSISVVEILEIPGDVDYSVGNIEFRGTVVIKGGVLDNFKVRATEDIIVYRNIGKSFVKAGGDVKVMGGIIGKEKGIVQAGKDIFAKFVEQAHLTALRNVIVSEMCLHSRVDAGGSIVLPGRRGQLAGGVIRAAYHIVAKEIGAVGAPNMKIVAGIDPQFLKEIQRYEVQLVETIEARKKLEETRIHLEKEREAGKLDQQRELDYREIVQAARDLADREAKIHKLIDESRSRTGVQKDTSVSATEKVYVGVQMEVNRLPFVVSRHEYQHVTFRAGKDRVQFFPYQSSIAKKILEDI